MNCDLCHRPTASFTSLKRMGKVLLVCPSCRNQNKLLQSCYYCEQEFDAQEMNRKKVYDSILQQTIEVDVCEACENMINDGLMQDPNQDLN